MNGSLPIEFQQHILECCNASRMLSVEVVQQLWSGYGQILRIRLEGGGTRSVIAKHIRMPGNSSHPRGWNTDLSHQRKLKSYQVEAQWYLRWGRDCRDGCRVPELLSFKEGTEEMLLVLEDLDASGYPARLSRISPTEIRACLDWLASFHATYLGKLPDGIWEIGTYWHLDTRPDELDALTDQSLKHAASAIDERLKNAKYQTFVHGDAKLANFCFSDDGRSVAAVDFQYVGGGCGMKDVAYFIGSCLDETNCELMESELLDHYFASLKAKLKGEVDSDALESEWRELFPVAWTDFHRFLKGWSPGHWKINSYSERLAKSVIADVRR